MDMKNIADLGRGKTLQEFLNQYKETVAKEYYRDHLEEYNPEFAAQVNEFKEGNLLFEMMQRTIWDKAAADSLGLKKYYESNKSRYWWAPSAEAVIFTCTDSATAYQIKSKIEKNTKDWRNIVRPFENKVQVDSGRFELAQIPGLP